MDTVDLFITGYEAGREDALVAVLGRLGGRSPEAVWPVLANLPARVARGMRTERAERLAAAIRAAGGEVSLRPAADRLHQDRDTHRPGQAEHAHHPRTASADGPAPEMPARGPVLVPELPSGSPVGSGAGSLDPPIETDITLETPSDESTRIAAPVGGGGNAAVPNRGGGSPPPAGGGAPRPLRLLARFGWGLRIAWETKWAVAVMLVAGTVLGAVFQLLLGGVGTIATKAGGGLLTSVGGAVLGILALLLSLGLSGLIWSGLVQTGVRYLEEGARPPVGTLLRGALARAPESATVSLLAVVPLLLLGGLGGGLGAYLWFVVGKAGAALAGVLTASLAMFVLLGLGLAMPVAVLETVGPLESLRRSWRLVRGRRLKLFGALLLFGFAVALLGAGLMLAAGAIAGVLTVVAGPVGAAIAGVVSIVVYVVLTFLLAFVAFFIPVSFYLEARVLEERWAPSWLVSLDESWPLGGGLPERAENRGLRAWGELAGAFVLVLVVAGGVVLSVGMAVPGVNPSALALQMLGGGGAAVAATGRSGQGVLGGGRRGSAGHASGTAVAAAGARAVGTETTGGEFGTLSLGTCFGSGEKDPTCWLEVELSPEKLGLPAGLSPENLVEVVISSATSRGGQDLYASGHQLESEFFRRPTLSAMPGSGRLKGIRQVHLRSGSDVSGLDRMAGQVSLTVPRGVEAVRVSQDQVGRRLSLPGGGVVETSRFEAKRVAFALGAAPAERYVGIVGEGTDGERLTPVSRSRSGAGETKRFSFVFPAEITAASLYLARSVSRQEYPFVVNKGARVALSVGTAVGSTTAEGGDSRRVAWDSFQAGHYGRAVEQASRLIEASPNDGWAWYLRGWSYWKLGRRGEAEHDVARACDLGFKDGCKLAHRG